MGHGAISPSLMVLFRCVSTYPGESVRWSVTLSDFHPVGVSGPSWSVRRPWDVIHFLKAVTNSFQILIIRVTNLSPGGGGGGGGDPEKNHTKFGYKKVRKQ